MFCLPLTQQESSKLPIRIVFLLPQTWLANVPWLLSKYPKVSHLQMLRRSVELQSLAWQPSEPVTPPLTAPPDVTVRSWTHNVDVICKLTFDVYHYQQKWSANILSWWLGNDNWGKYIRLRNDVTFFIWSEVLASLIHTVSARLMAMMVLSVWYPPSSPPHSQKIQQPNVFSECRSVFPSQTGIRILLVHPLLHRLLVRFTQCFYPPFESLYNRSPLCRLRFYTVTPLKM